MAISFKILALTIYISVAAWVLTSAVGAERILALAPIAGKSHWSYMRGILYALTDRGHQVTVLTPFPEGSRENYTEIDLSDESLKFVHLKIADAREQFGGCTAIMNAVNQLSRSACQAIYEHNFTKRIMADRASVQFDVVFAELMASECNSYLAAKLNLPLVYVTPPPLISYMERPVLGHYPNPAVVSHVLNNYSVPRTFIERFISTVLLVYTSCLLQFKNRFPNEDDKQIFDSVEPVKPSIVFSNTHHIIDSSRPLPPNVIPVGGIHLSPPKKVPDDILEFIENSPHGVIVFTLGSVVSTSSLPNHVKKSFIEALGQVPQRVLWKYEGEMENKPKNVMTKEWLPQRDILLHPNVKLFISHGGVCGAYEAIDAGVPVLGFPIIFDQSRNLRHLEDAGMAIVMNLESISKDSFLKAILELVNNKKYMKNAKIACERFKDRPMSPADTVNYWTKYVIRHKGAPHLKSHALNLTWYQYLLLDVIAVSLLSFILLVYIVYKGSKIIFKYFVFNVKSKPE